MPRSTATMVPSASTNRFPGCMSAWKKPSRSVWRRKDCTRLAAIASRSWPAARKRLDIDILMPSIHSMVSTSRPVRSQSTAGTRKPGSSAGVLAEFREGGGLQPQIHLDLGGLRQRLASPRPAAAGASTGCSVPAGGRRGNSFRDRGRSAVRTPGRMTFTATFVGHAVAQRPRPDAPARSRRRRPARRS